MRQAERWIAWVRVAAVPVAAIQVAIVRDYPQGAQLRAWLVTMAFAVGSVALLVLSRRDLSEPRQLALSVTALIFDGAIISAYLRSEERRVGKAGRSQWS